MISILPRTTIVFMPEDQNGWKVKNVVWLQFVFATLVNDGESRSYSVCNLIVFRRSKGIKGFFFLQQTQLCEVISSQVY